MSRQKNSILRFGKPAPEWLEGLPLGNGITAAMLWGSPDKTVLSLNHVDYWRDEVDFEAPDYAHHTAEIRRLLMAGQAEEADVYIREHILPTGLPINKRPKYHDLEGKTNSFEPVGNLFIELSELGIIKQYKRFLDLHTGIASIHAEFPERVIDQECFIPQESDTLMFHMTSKDRLDGHILFAREHQDLYKWYATINKNEIFIDGIYAEGVQCCTLVQAISRHGEVQAGKDRLSFTGIKDLLLMVAVEVGREGDELESRCREKIQAAEQAGYDRIKRRHITEHRAMFDRVELSLSALENPSEDTDALIQKAIEGHYANELAEQVFQFGRYLILSCNRAGRRPANLQGIWNDNIVPMWGADFHLDMNLQMNHWLCNPTNLDECNLALFNQIERLLPQGRELAEKIAGCGGILYDLIAGGDGMNWNCYSMWMGAAAWLAQHYWTHYEYTLDLEFLRERAYPFTKEAGLFYRDFLIKNKEGHYVAPPSFSPENRPEEGYRHNIHCTMDTALVREVMRHLLEAGRILDVDNELWPVWQDLHDKVLPYPVSSDGVLKEWPEPLKERPAHRHYSHLYPLFPGDEFTPERTPDLYKASREAVRLRESCGRAHNFGWSYPYLALFYARFGEGDNALENLHCLARAVTVDNLLTCGCDWKNQGLTVQWSFNVKRLFQIEAGLGASAAIAEMLLLSHAGSIHLLPALPAQWSKGFFKGLRARGAFTVDAWWDKGRIQKAVITSYKGQRCRIRCGKSSSTVSIMKPDGRIHSHAHPESGVLEFDTQAGGKYHIIF